MGNACPCGDKTAAQADAKHAEEYNYSFVFIKPHANNEAVLKLVKEKFKQNNMAIIKDGWIAAEDIDSKKLIDTHYGSIASRAMKATPGSLVVQPKAAAQFKETFGLEWTDALKQGLVFNAREAATKLNTDFDGIGAKWAPLRGAGKCLKFGGGFYVGQMDGIYVVNGFYMDMRKMYTKPGQGITYFVVKWQAKQLPWADFRGKVIGATNPDEAKDGSIRRAIFDNWQALGLETQPNTGENGVHASASSFEGLCERCNWLGAALSTDPFGMALVAHGVPQQTIQAWMTDPPVNIDGKLMSIFDHLEDTDGKECLERCAKVSAQA